MQNAFFVGIFQHRHHQAVGCVGGKTDVPILFVNQCIAIERAVELRELLQGRDTGFDEKGQHGDFDAALFVFFVGQHPKGFELGDVGVIMVGDRWNHHRVAQQIGTTDFLNPAQFFALDRTEFGEVHLGPGNQAQACTIASWGFAALRLGAGLARHDRAAKRLDVFQTDAAFGARAFDFVQGHAEFAGKFAHRG